MMTAWHLYWLTRLDGLKDLMEVVLIFGIIGWLVFMIVGCVNCSDGENGKWEWKPFRALAWKSGVALLLVGLLYEALPSTKELAAILILPKVANSQTVQELGEHTKTLVVEWLEELRPKSKVEPK